jgi:arylsulfatase A-like enzyme
VNWFYVGRKFGLDQGFDEFNEVIDPDYVLHPTDNSTFDGKAVTDQALSWLADQGDDQPFFLFLHYFDPHVDYAPPEPYASLFDPEYQGAANGTYDWIQPYIKNPDHEPPAQPIHEADREHIVALYDGEIRYVDTQLERLYAQLVRLGMLENTMLVVVGDHGEEFNEHGSMEGHGWTLYEEILHVPLLVRFPGAASTGRSGELIQLIDVAPMILEAVAVPAPGSFQGRSFLNGVRSGQ